MSEMDRFNLSSNVGSPEEASTVVPSQAPSEFDVQKEEAATSTTSESPSREHSFHLEPIATHHTTNEKDEQAFDKTVSQQRRDAEADVEYPHGIKMVAIVAALCLAVLCVALDNSIIATAIPHITDDFKALSDVGWYGSAYLLTTAAFQLFFGRLYTVFNIKWVFLTALFIFELGSLLCGVAPNSTALIVGRAIAGLGSSGLFSGALIILAHSSPLEKRPLYTGFIGGMYGIASVIGPLLGGAFTDHATWRWCFYINLPLGAVTAVVLVFFLHLGSQEKIESNSWYEAIARFDPLGTALFLPAIICVLLALQWGGTTYAWNDGRIIALFTLFGVLIVCFVAVQFWMGKNATLPIHIIKQRTIASASFFALCVGAAFFLMVYYIPIWFQAIRGASAVQSGIDTLPMLLAVVISSVLGGGLVTKLGYYTPFFYISVVFTSIGAGLLTLYTPEIATASWIGYQIIFGLGIGFGMQQGLVAAQTVLPIIEVPTGTAIIIFAQMFGGALFVSVGQNTFTNNLVKGVVAIGTNVDPAQIVNAGATEIGSLFKDPAELAKVILAYNGALTKTFQVSLILACLSVFGAAGIEWKSVKGKKIEMGAAA